MKYLTQNQKEAKRLKDIMKKNSYSLRYVARHTGLSHETIRLIINKKTTMRKLTFKIIQNFINKYGDNI